MDKLMIEDNELESRVLSPEKRSRRVSRAVSASALNSLCLEGSVRGKCFIPIDRHDRVIDALHKILGANINALVALEQEERIGKDPEVLHHMRVVIRKMRVALSFFQDFIPPHQYKLMRRQLRTIFQSLSIERDIDVTIQLLEPELDRHPKHRDVLLDCMQWLQSKKETNHQKTIQVFDSDLYSHTINQIRRFISDTPYNQLPQRTYQTIEETIPEKLKQTWKQLRKQGNALTLKSRDEKFHDVRLSCKKMRYICESLTAVYDEPVLSFIQQLKTVQKKLGKFQDTITAQNVLQQYFNVLAGDENLQSVKGMQNVLKKMMHKARRQQSKYFVIWDQINKVKPKLFDLSPQE